MNIFLIMCIVSASTGIIITDNVLFYEGDLKITAFSIGDTVTVMDQHGDTIFIQHRGKKGTLLQGVLIDCADSIAEEQLFVFGRGYYDERMYAEAVRLFVHFLHFYPTSIYYPEALFYTGLALEELAHLGVDYDSLSGITKNEKTGKYFYAGSVYKHLLEKYPSSIYAASAAYRFILGLRAASEPWDGKVHVIEKDLSRLQNLIDTYKEFKERAVVLEEIGYVNRVLYELSGDIKYHDAAVATFKQVVHDYPVTVHEASARIHLYEIENSIPIYLY